MKSSINIPCLSAKSLFVLTFVCLGSCCVSAQSEHSGYMHALADLRAARWLIDQRDAGDDPSTDEQAAMHSIEIAVAYIINADIDDGKYFKDHPDVGNIDFDSQQARVQRAVELLLKARTDVKLDEDASFFGGLQSHVIAQIDDAVRWTEKLQGLASR